MLNETVMGQSLGVIKRTFSFSRMSQEQREEGEEEQRKGRRKEKVGVH